MINRLYIKNHLSFKEAELFFDKGLSVFTGVSGAGKSVLMNAILSVFGLSETEASLIEADVDFNFDLSEFGIENEKINNFRMLKDKSTRYFINSQFISKKNLNLISSSHIKYLSIRNADEFNNENLLKLLDLLAIKKDKNHKVNLEKLAEIYKEFSNTKKELLKIENEEKNIEELKDFAKFEINKISSIDPKIGEFEELMELKKRLSKADKINEAWARADVIFEIENSVIEALRVSDLESEFFSEALNELRTKKESLNLDDLENVDIEYMEMIDLKIAADIYKVEEYLKRKYNIIKERMEIIGR